MSDLEFVKMSLRIDHSKFDEYLEDLIEASKEALVAAGATIREDDKTQRIAHAHFCRVNFKNGQMTQEADYTYPSPWHIAVEQARLKNE